MKLLNELKELLYDSFIEAKEPNASKLIVLINKISFGKDQNKNVSDMIKSADKLLVKIKKDKLISPNGISDLEKRLNAATSK